MMLSLAIAAAALLGGVVSQSATTTVARPPWQTGIVTDDGTCGPANDWVCSPVWGACCSQDGQCGRSDAFCGTGCQSKYGNCNAATKPAPGPGSPSPNGSCGGTSGFNCTGTTFGDCCSSGGWCGSSTAHCGTGCQSLFGACLADGNTGPVSTDGMCGASHGNTTCKNSGYGQCCSAVGYCGSGDDYCAEDCQPAFGVCPGAKPVTTAGSCGAVNGQTCAGGTFGPCCSGSGYCGNSTAHCSAGCQAGFGKCDDGADNVSTNGGCGPNFGNKTCKGSGFGDCCSSSGYCGDTSTHCSAGCQAGFGKCDAGADNISTDGKCGSPNGGKTCKGSGFGDCCGSSGYCGDTSAHCDAGCQSDFGTCAAGSGAISTDGKCGSSNGSKTCKGSTFGDCCSSGNYCGASSTHCGVGCQSAFGTCSAGSASISTDGVCGSNGKTCVGSVFGSCCSASNQCGATAKHCGQGCQKGSSSACATSNIASNDGSCGSNSGGLTCAGGDFDNQCCSSSGYCGTTSAHCGSGCQKGFGRCN